MVFNFEFTFYNNMLQRTKENEGHLEYIFTLNLTTKTTKTIKTKAIKTKTITATSKLDAINGVSTIS
jgi:hypothetical protein